MLLEQIQSQLLVGADADDLRQLDEIKKKKQALKKNFLDLEKRSKEHEETIEQAQSVLASESSKQLDSLSLLSGDTIDCVSCGKTISHRKFATHSNQCIHQRGGTCNFYDSKTATFCDQPFNTCSRHQDKSNLKNGKQICGCPTSDFESGFCERSTENCPKHLNWQMIRRAELVQEKMTLNQSLEELEVEKRTTQLRISRRHQSSLSEEKNQTIVETSTSNSL